MLWSWPDNEFTRIRMRIDECPKAWFSLAVPSAHSSSRPRATSPTLIPWYFDILIPWYLDTLIPRYLYTWYLDTSIHWCRKVMICFLLVVVLERIRRVSAVFDTARHIGIIFWSLELNKRILAFPDTSKPQYSCFSNSRLGNWTLIFSNSFLSGIW